MSELKTPKYGWDNPAPGTRHWRLIHSPETLTLADAVRAAQDLEAELAALRAATPLAAARTDPLAAEPTNDTLWEVVAASLAIAGEHKLAIYRGAEGVPAPEALAGIQKHIEAGLAARVMYERLLAARTPDAQP